MLWTLPTGDAGDLHEVALDELGGVLEARVDRVGAAAVAEQEHGHDRQRRDQRGGGEDPSQDVGRRQAGLQGAGPQDRRDLSLAAPNEPQSQNLRLFSGHGAALRPR